MMTHRPIHSRETRGPQRPKQTRLEYPRRVDVAQGRQDPRAGPRARTRHQCPMQPGPARPLTRGLQTAAAHRPTALTWSVQPTGRPHCWPSPVGPTLRRPGRASSPAPCQLPPGPPRPAPQGRLRTCTARTRPRPVSWPCRSCSRMLAGRGRPPHPPQAATVPAARRPRLAPDPTAAGAAAMSPRPTNRKQAAPGPRRLLRGGGGVAAAPPAGCQRRRKPRGRDVSAAGPPGKCSPGLRRDRCKRITWSFLHQLFFRLWVPHFCEASQAEDKSMRVRSLISCLFGDVTANWPGKDPGLQAGNQAGWSNSLPASLRPRLAADLDSLCVSFLLSSSNQQFLGACQPICNSQGLLYPRYRTSYWEYIGKQKRLTGSCFGMQVTGEDSKSIYK